MKPILNFKQDRKKKESMWPSDCFKLEADIILSLQSVEPTNPPEWTDSLKWEAGKGVEMQMLKILKENGVVNIDYTQEGESRKATRLEVPISYRLDAMVGEDCSIKTDDTLLPQGYTLELKKGEPIEVKTINNKNEFDIAKYIDNKPKENYVCQLAMYMDLEGIERGHLFAATIDGLQVFWFTCLKREDGLYQCGDTVVDIQTEYKRWADIWSRKDKEPNWSEVLYKTPIEKIDWTKFSKYAIGEIRNNRKVAGDENQWKVLYSPYRDLILEKQNVKRGYTPEEIARIQEITKGYTAKK